MCKFWKKWFTKNQKIELTEEEIMKKFLIVGLGNIGEKYTETRHNIGFKILDHLANSEEATFETAKLGDLCTVKVKGRSLILLKPSTYMNLSGKGYKVLVRKRKNSITKPISYYRRS